jgi:hypothetical protein
MRTKISMLFLMVAACASYAIEDNRKTTGQVMIIEKLKQIENSYISRLDFEERREAIRLMDEILISIKNTPEMSCQNRFSKDRHSSILSDDGFQELLKLVKGEINEDRKTNLIQTCAIDGHILSTQLALLLSTYSFDSYKIDCIKKVYPHVYDKVNSGILFEQIHNSILRDELINDLKK